MFFPESAFYMEKIATGPEAADAIDITEDADRERPARGGASKGLRPTDIVAIVLERPRHEELIAELREAGARVHLIRDGDVAPSIAASGLRVAATST